MIHLITRVPLPYHQTLCRTLHAEFKGNFCAWFAERTNQEFPFRAGTSFEFPHNYLSEVGYQLLWRDLKKDRNALVILGGWSSPMTNKTLLITTTLGIPLFIWTDHPHPRQRSKVFAILRRSFLRLLSATAVSGFLVCGRPTAEYLSRLGIARESLIEFPYWVDVPNDWTPPARCVDGNAAGPLRLIAIGRLAVVKQFEVAIRALGRVNQQGQRNVAHLTIAGDGPEKKALQSLASSLRVEHSVSFAGWLEGHEVQSALRASDALLITSRFDAYGVAVLEAMAEGRPILASDTVIAAVDRSDGSDAIQMHAPGDDDLLAQQILSLANNPEQLRHASIAARAIAEKWRPERAGAIMKQIQSELSNGANPIPAQSQSARDSGTAS